jgi:hypothetical protein
MESNVIATASLTSDCTCEVYDDETGESTPATECLGYCFDDMREDVENLIQDWLDGPSFEGFTVEVTYSGVNWNRLSGKGGWEPESVKEVWQALTLDGDYTLRFKLLSDGILEVVRSSHDELGAYHALRLIEKEGE